MSLIDEIQVREVHRDRYSRENILSNGIVNIQCPCEGIGIKSKKDLETFMNLRLTYPTERLGFCLISLTNSDDTFIENVKKLEEEKYKLSPTAEGRQIKMFTNQTFLAVEPACDKTYYFDKDAYKKILTSLETPTFLKTMVKDILKKAAKYTSAKSEEFQKWKKEYFEEKWLELNSDPHALAELVDENFDSQNRCGANIHIPPTPPLITPSMFYVAVKIIEEATKRAKNSTAVYFNMPFSILKNQDLRHKVLDYCEKSKNKLIILKIRDLDNMLDPDKEDEREAFSEIQDIFCGLRKNAKCTILFEGGKLTIPSLVRGFDIVVNNFSGRNKKGFGKTRKDSTDPIGYSQYFIKEKLIFYQFPKMVEYVKNQLELTGGEHGLKCNLPCCIDVKSIEDINRDIWNYSVTRSHYALTMNEIVKEISKLINKNQIHKAKDMILLSELCVLKHLMPDV